MKVVFFTAGRHDPSARYRIRHFFPYLESQGVRCRELVSHPSKFYVPAVRNRFLFLIAFGFFLVVKTIVRLFQLPWCWWADVVVIQREMVPFGLVPVERLAAKLNRRIVFDFDDAIFIYHNDFGRYLERRATVPKILRTSRRVIAGNSYLASYARQYNDQTVIIPTALDTAYYTPEPERTDSKVVIGWIGTHGNLKYLLDLLPTFTDLSERFGDQVELKIVADRFETARPLQDVIKTNFKRWSARDDLADLRSFDIGIMPMPDNDWTRGKCGFKLLQYMACGAAAVGSPVGVNVDIIQDGQNGFLAQTPAEWTKALTKLIDDKQLRQRLATSARETVTQKYSVSAVAPVFYQAISK